MKRAPIPEDDEQRLATLYRYEVLDVPPEQAFDDLTKLVAHILGVPMSLVSLVDRDRQWFLSRQGLDAEQTPRDVSFCGHAVTARQTLWVPDATADERFADNPLVTGEPHVVFYIGVPLITPDGFALGTLCAIDHEPRQLTEQQVEMLEALTRQAMNQIELRHQLRQRDAMLREREALEQHKDAFISLVSHELRTPLTAIRGSLKLVEAGVAGEVSEKANEMLAMALRNSDRLLRLISDALDLERLQKGTVSMVREPVDLVELAGSSVDNIVGFADHEGVSVSVEAADRVPVVYGDRDQLMRVMDNLLSNAIKYSPVGESVSVVVSETDGLVRVAVRDCGPGVPEAFRQHLFKRFARSSTPSRSQQPSSGLGLALAKQVAELHGGDIAFEPNQPTGACFVVELPSGLVVAS